MSRRCLSLQQPLRRVSKDPHSFLGLTRALILQEKPTVAIRRSFSTHQETGFIFSWEYGENEQRKPLCPPSSSSFLRHISSLRHNITFSVYSRLILLYDGIWIRRYCDVLQRGIQIARDMHRWHWESLQHQWPVKLLKVFISKIIAVRRQQLQTTFV